MKTLLILVIMSLPLVLQNRGSAAERRESKEWQRAEVFADGTVVHQNNVYMQKRVPLNHFDRPVVVKQRVKIYRPPVMLVR